MKKKADKAPLTTKTVFKKGNPFGLKSMADELVQWFKSQDENDEPLFKVLDMFPIPIQIFAPDGTEVFANRANLEFSNVKNPSLVIGKYNVLTDPVCNDDLGMREGIQKAFRGEFQLAQNYPVPIQDLIDRGIIKEKPFEAATMDYLLYPIWKNDKLHFVVCVFIVKSIYYGRPDVARAREYIDQHWKEKYNKTQLANAVNMSASQLYKVFNEQAGMPPGEYYNRVKVQHIKEKLDDPDLSIKEAFAQCGESSQGWVRKVFKEIIGLSPSQYRKQINKEQ